MDKPAKPKEITVKITGNIALFDIVKSPTFACVRKISKNEVRTVALEDFNSLYPNKQGNKTHTYDYH